MINDISIFFWLFIIISSPCLGQNENLTSYLPENYVKDGSIDYTDFLQKGINENTNVIFPNFKVLVNEDGLTIRSGQTLTFLRDSSLEMQPNLKDKYGLLHLINVKNVIIKNPTLVGDREEHQGISGEWGMGINILSSSNITVINPKISKFWGDGIYIGEIDYKSRINFKLENFFCKNITICGGILDNNRRNGISIISVKDLIIDGTLIKNTEGTLPMSGIDIEPNNNSQFLENIIISNVTTRNNYGVGFKFVPSNFYGKRSRLVNINLENCQDFYSNVGLYLGGARASSKGKKNKLTGNILVKNFKSYSNNTIIKTGSIQNYNPQILLQSFSVFKDNKRDRSLERKIESGITSKNIIFIK